MANEAPPAGGGFSGTGLRRDQDILSASAALARPSYYVYQRWQDLLGGNPGVLIRPETATRYHDLDPASAADSFVVLRFPGTRSLPFAWVMFVDSASGVERVSVQIQFPRGISIQPVPLVPVGSRGWFSGDASEFREDEAIFASPPPPFSPSGESDTLVLALDADPLLWFTNELLSFTRVWGT